MFSAITWDGIVRFRERQSNVRYPAEVYDDEITEHECNYLADPSFLKGWNFTTDMYRVLEHLVGRLRNRRQEPDAISAMFPTAEPSAAVVIAHLEARQAALPVVYRSTQIMTGDDKQDSFGFQAANIAITFQTVKLALAGAENHSVGKNCEIAGELLDVLASIPTSYIMAISTPMVCCVARVLVGQRHRAEHVAPPSGELWTHSCQHNPKSALSLGSDTGAERLDGDDRPVVRLGTFTIARIGCVCQAPRTRCSNRELHGASYQNGSTGTGLSQRYPSVYAQSDYDCGSGRRRRSSAS